MSLLSKSLAWDQQSVRLSHLCVISIIWARSEETLLVFLKLPQTPGAFGPALKDKKIANAFKVDGLGVLRNLKPVCDLAPEAFKCPTPGWLLGLDEASH